MSNRAEKGMEMIRMDRLGGELTRISRHFLFCGPLTIPRRMLDIVYRPYAVLQASIDLCHTSQPRAKS